MAASCAKSLDTKKEAAISAARRLGYQNFKPEQMEVVLGFISGRDVFVSLPTGYGKSLCYACLPWTFDIIGNGEPSIVLVISPLLSLMQDQVTGLSGLSCRSHDTIGRSVFETAIAFQQYTRQCRL